MSAHAYYRYRRRKKKLAKQVAKEPLVYFAIIIGPLMTLPQLYEIWFKSGEGVSIVSWLAYTLTSAIWLWHGWKVKDAALIFVQTVWLILSAGIVVGLMI